ncbi:A24 family peptidase [Amycolatopsis sp. SID8362]|uniref:prepilin peptidase n=1 Tax=Amycolatopsis sp. SID8362 TaxID=2690346 RepID=UPI001370EFA4|nr:A24 family peptidase [Amycolatopsis sp. SID8362]NBH09617.1 prepilin peptidase [Amycolatopsis sp. SID8362]NED46309.1 prepilin peptidase [Amycolatopsis sp. SID8362]
MAVLVVATAVLGLLVGSFLNVVIHRVPRGESVVRPPSRCPGCGEQIRARHNVPVLGWLLLRGRCANCGSRISVRYPLVELGTAVLFALLTLRLDPPDLPAYLYFGAIGIALALIDLDCRRLPDAIVLPSYPVLAVLLTSSAWYRDDWWALARAGIGGAALFGFYLLLALVHPQGMGFGDVKLAGILGGVLGYLSWTALLLGAFGGFLLGAVAGVVVLAAGRGDRKTALPFGPFMIAAALIAVFVADPLARAYRELTGLA